MFAPTPKSGEGAVGAGKFPVKFSAPPRRPTGVILVGAATRMPSVLGFIRHVTGLEPSLGVDPEEAVALGAAIHAGTLQVGSGMGFPCRVAPGRHRMSRREDYFPARTRWLSTKMERLLLLSSV